MKRYRPYAPEQWFLLPPSPREWLPEGHLAYFILGLIGELDLTAIEKVVHAKDPRGERPYSPEMMTSLLLYGYASGVFSSRRIARACVEGRREYVCEHERRAQHRRRVHREWTTDRHSRD